MSLGSVRTTGAIDISLLAERKRSKTFRRSSGKAANAISNGRYRHLAPRGAKPEDVFCYLPWTLISFTRNFLPLLSVSTRVLRSKANSPAGYFWRLFGCGVSDLASAGVSVFVCSGELVRSK